MQLVCQYVLVKDTLPTSAASTHRTQATHQRHPAYENEVVVKQTCFFSVTRMQERWVLTYLQNQDMESSLLLMRVSMFHSFSLQK